MANNTLNLEALIGNIDIAKHIVQFLHYHDHLNLLRVSKQFENIISNFIWKCKYRQVKVVIKPGINLLSNRFVTSGIPSKNDQLWEDWQFLKSIEFEEFLKLNTTNIENLKVRCKFSFSEDHSYHGFHVYDEFPNLTSLSLYGVILADYDLKLISQNCPALHTLVLADCVNAREQVLVLGHDVKVTTIANMKKLKCFTVKCNYIYRADMHMYNYRHIQDILRNINIEKLRINVAIYSDYDGYDCSDYIMDNNVNACYLDDQVAGRDEKYSEVIPSACQELEIGQFHRSENFSKFYQTLLSKYENLTKLDICGRDMSSAVTIQRDFFVILSATCTNLNRLKLSDCVIVDFVPLPTLHELTLTACRGLNCSNLKQILGEMQLTSFKTFRTKYSGNLEHFSLSQSLQHIELDFQDSQFVELFEQKLPNLVSLHWHYASSTHYQIPNHIPNLQILNIIQNRLNNIEINQLKSLHTLTLRVCQNISDCLKLLQHPTLKQLTLGNYDHRTVQQMPRSTDDLVKHRRTNLLFLNIPLKLFKALQDFWLDILSQNAHLILVVTVYFYRDVNDEFMYNLINNKKFPPRLKCIKFCGLYIDCADLKNYFAVIMKKIEVVTTILWRSPQPMTLVFSDRCH